MLEFMDRDSSVGIATRYGLDGPGIEYRCEARFSATVQTGPGTHTASYTMGTRSFSGVKRPKRGVDHPPPSRAEVKERVELYVYPPWAFVACSMEKFTLTFTFTKLEFIWKDRDKIPKADRTNSVSVEIRS